MIAAFQEFEHINCANHLLNNVVEKSIHDVPSIDILINKSTKLVKYFKKSGVNTHLNTTLKSYTITRWNTVYYMLKSIIVNFDEIISILLEKN